MSFIPRFLCSQLAFTPPVPTTDCTGKTIIVTGGNTGLGKEAVRHFVRLNATKVITTSRTPEKGEASKREIEESTGRKGVIEIWPLDLTDYENVKRFAKRVEGLERIDAVLENAGMLTDKFSMVAGNEATITVNVVSTFLLALLLLPKLRAVGKKYGFTPTLTVVSSEVQFFASFPERKADSIFAALNDPNTKNMSDRYWTSKLLEVLVCREIVRNHPIDSMGVTLNFVNPGWCYSELEREGVPGPVKAIGNMLKRTTEVGSRCLVHAALCGPETHGKYMSDCTVRRNASIVEGKEGPELQRRVWMELSGKLEAIQPGVTRNLAGK
jgi:NAD(P)-dependent dehydrogenase (short-subunit alcohol dehydrogenase family)